MSIDPTTWGVQPNGFVVPTAEDILGAIEADQRAYVDSALDQDPDSPTGQNNGIFAAQLALAWEAVGALEAARSRDGAEGALLDDTGKLTGTARDGARATVVPCQVVLDSGTTLTVDHLASIAGRPELTFSPVVDAVSGFTAPSSGSHNLSFRCTQTGPIVVAPGTLTVITTPVSGWVSITNAQAGVTGADIASDAQLRDEQEADLAQAGSSTARAIESALPWDAELESGVPGVLTCRVLENETDEIDANGLPPHSFEVVVHTDTTEDPDAIAEKIWSEKPAGIYPFGSLSGTYVDESGVAHVVHYSEVTQRPVYLSYAFVTGSEYIGTTEAKAAIVAALTAKYGVGDDVNALHAHALPLSFSGVNDVTSFTLGFTASPVSGSNLSISVREIATFDVSRIAIS